MTLKEVNVLIAQLRTENESNTAEEKEFNNQWIACLHKSIAAALAENGY